MQGYPNRGIGSGRSAGLDTSISTLHVGWYSALKLTTDESFRLFRCEVGSRTASTLELLRVVLARRPTYPFPQSSACKHHLGLLPCVSFHTVRNLM